MPLFFQHLSIWQKILLFSSVFSVLVLLAASVAFMLNDYITKGESLAIENSIFVRGVGAKCKTFLRTNNIRAAEDVLSLLHSKPYIVTFDIYTESNELFAHYQSNNKSQDFLKTINSEEKIFQNLRNQSFHHLKPMVLHTTDFLYITSPILWSNKLLGVSVVRMDPQTMHTDVIGYIGTLLALILLLSVLVYVLARHLQHYLLQPIARLSDAMSNISRSGKYTGRVDIVSNDELGDLTQSFNALLEKIQNKNTQLTSLIEELKYEKKTADNSTRSKSEFLAKMSHEIRTPINGVLGVSELMLQTPLSDEQKHYCEIIVASGRSLLVVINDILDFSKIESGMLTIENINFNLRECIQECVELQREHAERKSLCFTHNVDDDVPDWMVGDPGRVQQVLTNLVSNAIKFTESGRVCVNVNVIRRNDKSVSLYFKVTDTGIGISAHKHKAIFKSFSQAEESTTRRYGGTGLGLSISKQLVEIMGGSIGVDSSMHNGAEFWFKLTLNVSQLSNDSSEKEVSQNISSGGATLPRFDGKFTTTILIAEDNAVNQLVIRGVMNSFGCVPVIADTGLAAIKAFKNGGIDLVLMDIQMPDMNGTQAAAQIRQFEREHFPKKYTPIIAFTANAMRGDKEAYLAAGMDDYLSKPINLNGVSDLLNRWIEDPEEKTNSIDV